MAGIYHLVAAGETTWHGYARFVLNLRRQAGIRLKAGAGRSCPGADQRISDARPPAAKFAPGHQKTAKHLRLELPPWQTGVARMLTETLEKSP